MSGLALRVFDAENQTQTGFISEGSDIEFVDEFNSPGYGQVTVPLDSSDAALLVKDAVVRVYYEDDVRFAWFVETLDRTLVDSTGRRYLQAAGRGLMAWLDDALVYPQGGLQENSSPDRPFNYASEDGSWKNSVTWSTPVGVRWKESAGLRGRQPSRWPDPDAQWIWSTDPDTGNVPRGTVNYFRSEFTLSSNERVKFWASFDNFGEVYIDGTLALSSAKFTEQAPSWTQFATYTTRLGKGTHTIAARVRNGKPWERTSLRVDDSTDKVSASDHGLANDDELLVTAVSKTGGGLAVGDTVFIRDVEDNAFKLAASAGGTAIDMTKNFEVDLRLVDDKQAGFLLTSAILGADGKPDKSAGVPRRTNQASWEVATEEPQYRPALILKELVEEAQARGVYRLDNVTFSFTNASPTSGAWSTYVDMFLKVGSPLLAVHDELVDVGMDFRLRPGTLVLDAWEARGTDRSTSVRLTPGRDLMQYATTSEAKLKTHALIRTDDDWSQSSRNSDDPPDGRGRREMYMEVGRTRSTRTARIVATRALRRTGKVRVLASTVETIPTDAVKPYVSFDVGDVISIPAPNGDGWKRARVLSIAMTDESGNARYMPELEVLDA